jgi:hypothetical protein
MNITTKQFAIHPSFKGIQDVLSKKTGLFSEQNFSEQRKDESDTKLNVLSRVRGSVTNN